MPFLEVSRVNYSSKVERYTAYCCAGWEVLQLQTEFAECAIGYCSFPGAVHFLCEHIATSSLYSKQVRWLWVFRVTNMCMCMCDSYVMLQLRHLLWTTSKHDVYTTNENCINHYSTLSRLSTQVSTAHSLAHLQHCLTPSRRPSHLEHITWARGKTSGCYLVAYDQSDPAASFSFSSFCERILMCSR